MNAIWVEIIEARGSTPRDAGTAMKVTLDGIEGTIGGGTLEYQAVTDARQMLVDGTKETTRNFALGPSLGQCCGGAVTLRFGRMPRVVDTEHPSLDTAIKTTAHMRDLWIWGAGHVGRAVVKACSVLDVRIIWVDTEMARFPLHIPAYATATPAADMAMLAGRAPPHAHHLIFTFSHAIDLALCNVLLGRKCASIGLIGSATKWARFRSRLGRMGHTGRAINQIECPIGDPSLGKHPQQIAAGVIARFETEFGAQSAREDVA